MHAVRDLRVLLRLRDFRSLLAARLLSQGADGVFQVALATFVVFSPEKQTSPAAIASAMAILLLPYSLLGPFTGVLLDRWRRRQVLLYGNLLRTLLAMGTAALIVSKVPDWLFYASALAVTAVNRFVLAGLSAALPRVVDGEQQLVMANSLTPTAGTLAATAGGGLAFAVRLAGSDVDAYVVLLAAALYFCSALTALRMAPQLLGPDPAGLQPHLREALLSTVRGLADGLRHLAERRTPARALIAMTVIRFCYGALTVMVLMLCRYLWSGTESEGLALLGITVGVSGAGFFAAAVVTPWAVGRLTAFGWIACCAAIGAVLLPSLGLFFTPGPMLAAAFVLGLGTQGTKISTDTIVQSSVDDAFRGRIFAIYDVLFNVAFVGAAAVAALMLPPDGRSAALLGVVTVLYAVTVAAVLRWGRG
ncbi:MFS transporter [Streptomyces decoyicus]|uniref:MFS transporter n=1 Tax=Streptomyces decoyicus TaxID=249567 RepID=UPI002E326699|nr:MFS transporter [Streptomyces decoyicus]